MPLFMLEKEIFSPLAAVFRLLPLDGEVLPLRRRPRGQEHAHRGHPRQVLVGGLVQRVLLEVQLLEAAGGEEGVEVHVRHVVVAGEEGGEGGQLGQHRRQRHEGVGRDVDGLQLGAGRHLARQHRHPVVGEVQLWNKENCK